MDTHPVIITNLLSTAPRASAVLEGDAQSLAERIGNDSVVQTGQWKSSLFPSTAAGTGR